MTRIYLIRHAEAEGNLYRIAQGQYDSLITDRGYRQIAALSRRFADIPIDAVYSSDLRRTCITAQALYVPKHLPLHKCKKLREICVGEWEQMTWGEIARRAPEELEHFTNRLDLWRVPGAETVLQVQQRMLEAVREISEAHDGETVAAFSHGMAIRILLAAIQGCSHEELARTTHGDNTAVSLIESDGGKLRVIFRDDNSHLASLPAQTRRKRGVGLEPGMYFLPTRLPEEAPFLTDCVRSGWGDSRSYDPETLLSQAAERPTLTAWLGERPAGVLQLNPEKAAEQGEGWISLYCMDSAYRNQGYGVQLLGQAVQYYRPKNRHILCLSLPDGSGEAEKFFGCYGFQPGEEEAGNRRVWRKDTGVQSWQGGD